MDQLQGAVIYLAALDTQPNQVATWEHLDKLRVFADAALIEHNNCARFANSHPHQPVAAQLADAFGDLAGALNQKCAEFQRRLMRKFSSPRPTPSSQGVSA